MSFGLKLAGAKKDLINQRVTQVAEVLQLAHLLERKPKALSGGQRQRVAIGRTLVAGQHPHHEKHETGHRQGQCQRDALANRKSL